MGQDRVIVRALRSLLRLRGREIVYTRPSTAQSCPLKAIPGAQRFPTLSDQGAVLLVPQEGDWIIVWADLEFSGEPVFPQNLDTIEVSGTTLKYEVNNRGELAYHLDSLRVQMRIFTKLVQE